MSLGNNQFGIRKNSSTVHAVIATHDAMTRYADDINVGACIFVAFDFSKAFDRIDHQKLIQRSLDVNLPSGFVRFLKDYLNNRHQRVRVNGLRSSLRSTVCGVPQGSILGPFLFGLFISSLQPLESSTLMVKYVDDISIVAPIMKASVADDLKVIAREIDNISQWSAENNLTLNASKTCGLIFSRGQFKEQHNIESLFINVQFMKSVRFLGIILDESLTWRSHVNFVVKKCNQRLYILRRLRSVTTKKEFFSIYCGIVRSLIEYACPVFVGVSTVDNVRLCKIQRRCLRIKDSFDAPDISLRRRSMAESLFNKLPSVDTLLKDFFLASLPSGRLSVPYCRTSLRRASFHLFHVCSCFFCVL